MATLDGVALDPPPPEGNPPDGGKYGDLSREALIALLERRDRERARIGIHWAADKAERDRAFNDDFVALRLVPELCDGPGPWDNLVVEGDNFDALRWLRMTMLGRVKCIFVDPPYNTGNQDWVYNDHFRDPSDPFHDTTWLEFLHRRFLIARDLLADDGVLFICINDEKRALLELMLEATLPGMKVGTLVWRTKDTGNDAGHRFSRVHEHILVFAGPTFEFGGTQVGTGKYRNPDDDPRGDWAPRPLTKAHTYKERANTYYPIQDPATGYWYPCDPNRVWAYATKNNSTKKKLRASTIEELIAQNLVYFPPCEPHEVKEYTTMDELLQAIHAGTGPALPKKKTPLLLEELPDLAEWVGKKIAPGRPSLKDHLSKKQPAERIAPLSSWILGLNEAASESSEELNSLRSPRGGAGTQDVVDVLGTKAFSFPKPVALVRELLRQSTGPGDLILDFFAGSGTTAQAVMELNREDGLGRRFVMVSHDEASEDHPDRNLTRDVLAERIRRLNARNGSDDIDPSPFAYLRTRLIPTDRLMDGATPGVEATANDLLPEDIWLAIQAMHGLPISAFVTERAIQVAEDETSVVAFCDTVTDAALDRLRVAAASRRAIHCYCWTPGPVRRALEGADAEIHRLPSALWDAFRS